MKWFKKDKGGVVDGAAGNIARVILQMQGRFAKFMERRSAAWGRKQQLIFLGVVSLLFFVLSVTAIVSGFSGSHQLTRPVHIELPRNVQTDIAPRITKEEFEKVQAFKSKLDSATMKARPGLMDSIRMVEELYYSKLK